MDSHLLTRIIHIAIANVAAGLLSHAASRYLPEFGKQLYRGLYLIFLVLAFWLLGWDLPAPFVSSLVLLGLIVMIVGIRHRIDSEIKHRSEEMAATEPRR